MKEGKKWILAADDDPELRQILKLLLSGEGYAVQTVEDGQAAVEAAREEIDLYILDVGMPRLSGILAAAKIRERFETPIIFLTAYSGESDKVMGFSVGADDYIVKPFSNVELLLRVKAILRRAESRGSRTLMIRDLTLDPDSQTVSREGETIPLTYTEFKILELLAINRRKIFSLDNIYQSIWHDDAVGDSAIMVHIKNIRKKLGDSSREPVYIKTAWGRGYYVD